MYRVVNFSQKFFRLQLLLLLVTFHHARVTTSKEFGPISTTSYDEYDEYDDSIPYGYSRNVTEKVIDPNRIVGGYQINIKKAPWQIALIKNGIFWCGGSIIESNWVLTAAHCVEQLGTYMIRAGTRYSLYGGITRTVANVISHSGYNPKTTQNDIAMLRLSQPLQFSVYLKPVRLASRTTKTPKKFHVTGWGAITEQLTATRHILRRTRVDFMPKEECLKRYRDVLFIPRLTICAASPGKDSCSGDSGGPLVFDNVQFGVVSFGKGCARRRYPGVYCDVRRYRNWISGVAKLFN